MIDSTGLKYTIAVNGDFIVVPFSWDNSRSQYVYVSSAGTLSFDAGKMVVVRSPSAFLKDLDDDKLKLLLADNMDVENNQGHWAFDDGTLVFVSLFPFEAGPEAFANCLGRTAALADQAEAQFSTEDAF